MSSGFFEHVQKTHTAAPQSSMHLMETSLHPYRFLLRSCQVAQVLTAFVKFFYGCSESMIHGLLVGVGVTVLQSFLFQLFYTCLAMTLFTLT